MFVGRFAEMNVVKLGGTLIAKKQYRVPVRIIFVSTQNTTVELKVSDLYLLQYRLMKRTAKLRFVVALLFVQ